MTFFHEEIGKVYSIIEPGAYSTATLNAATDHGSFRVEGYDHVLFILSYGDASASDVSVQVLIRYTSTGSASDLTELSWDTSAAFTALSTAVNNTIELMDLDLLDVAGDANGLLGATFTGDSDGTAELSLIAIPVAGTLRYPMTQTRTVLKKG